MKYEVSVECDYEQWWRYNVFMTVVGRSETGDELSYQNIVDRIYNIGDGSEIRQAPEGYTGVRPINLPVDECSYIEIYMYVIANTFPASSVIRETPSFSLDVTVKGNGRKIEKQTLEVNQWGGLTLIAHKVG